MIKSVVALLMLFLVLFCLLQEARAESRIALVIGNGAYGANPLGDPPNDAQLIVDTLKSLDFEVIGYIDVNQKEMKRLIRDFARRLKSQSDAVGLFYYSGHGMQVEGRNYMIPVGANILDESDVSIEGVGVDEVLTRMQYAQNAMNFIILDACRDNPFEKRFKSGKKGLGRMDAPKGSLIAFAAEPHKVALQGRGKYSIFTEALTREIVKPGITVEKMFKNARIEVDEVTNGRQLPVTESRLLDDFYFRPSRVEDDLTPKVKEIARDDPFIAYSDGTVVDTSTGLTWAAKDNGRDVNWQEANEYCENYRGGGPTDWRMPTLDELAGIYNKSKKNRRGYRVTELIDISACCPWASETDGSGAANFSFRNGLRLSVTVSHSYGNRALPVRAGN